MSDAGVLRELVGRRTEWTPLMVEPAKVAMLRQATGLSAAPYGSDAGSTRFDRPLAPPTFLALLRTIDPALGLPRIGPAVNGGNTHRWLRPVFVGDELRRRTELVAVESREGRAGPMWLVTTESSVMRGDELVAVARGTNIYR